MSNAIEAERRTFDVIVGEKLSAVVFVLDYWQLQFDGPSMSIMTRIEVRTDQSISRDGDDQFRNHLSGQIAKVVRRIELVPQATLAVVFEDESTISVSLRNEDYVGPEAIVFFDTGGKLLNVVRQGDL